MTPEFNRPYGVDRLPAGSLDYAVEASEAEARAVAERLELLALGLLRAHGRIERQGAGHLVRVEGEVVAELAQACVVTLEPVPATVRAPFERFFALGPEGAAGEVVVDPETPDVEPLEGLVIDVGELAVEELSLALDPYPRAPEADAVMADLDAGTAAHGDEPHPFAKMADQVARRARDGRGRRG